VSLLLVEILQHQTKLLEHGVQSSCLELILQVPDNGKSGAVVQCPVASFATLGNELHGYAASSADPADAADELGPPHMDSIGQICPNFKALPNRCQLNARTERLAPAGRRAQV
jgi:hypothetical protein